MKRTIMLMATFLLLGGMYAFTLLTSWSVTNEHSVKFSGKGVNGIFKTFNAAIYFDEANLSTSKFTITIDVASLNTGNAVPNRHATGPDWFDATKYPKIKFTSGTIEKTSAGYVVKGKMEVKNKVKDVTIPFQFTRSGTTGSFSSSFVIKRSDYGVGGASGEVSDEIKVELKVPVMKS